MASMVKVHLIGNVGREPEQRYTQDGTMRVQFSVAVNSRQRQADGSYQEQVEWYRVTTMGRLAEVCQQYVAKGTPIFVEGRLSVSRFTRQDGQPGFSLDVFASDVQLLGSRQSEDRPQAERPAAPESLEDIPF